MENERNTLDEKKELALRLLIVLWYICCPFIFLIFFVLFGSKGDITVPFFSAAAIAIVLNLIVEIYLKEKLALLIDKNSRK